MSTGNIVLKTSQSDKIAEISKKIQEQVKLHALPMTYLSIYIIAIKILKTNVIFFSLLSVEHSKETACGICRNDLPIEHELARFDQLQRGRSFI